MICSDGFVGKYITKKTECSKRHTRVFVMTTRSGVLKDSRVYKQKNKLDSDIYRAANGSVIFVWYATRRTRKWTRRKTITAVNETGENVRDRRIINNIVNDKLFIKN